MAQDNENQDFLKEVLEDYVVETGELLEQAEQDLLSLENEASSSDLLNRVFRAFHTVKGTSSFLGFERMAKLTHRAEDVLNLLRHGEMQADDRVIDVLLRVVDVARAILENIRSEGAEGEVSVSGVIAELDKVLSVDQRESAEVKGEREQAETEAQPQVASSQWEAGEEDTGERGVGGRPQHDGAPEEETTGISAEPARTPAKGVGPNRSISQMSQTVRVNVARLDEMMDLVGELVLVRNRIQQLVQQITSEHYRRDEMQANLGLSFDQLTTASEQLQFVSSQLQDAVTRIRMLPISNVFHRFPRMVRDLAKEKGKEAKLVIEGEETELDKSVLELISDPLVHLIRNAVDHGIEPPEEREAVGKPRVGTVRLSARHEGDHIVVEVEDDGRGIDPERVRNAAVNRGLLSEEEAKKLDDREVLDLIFLPGFSTSNKVTGTSGRGVGMDVVKTNITRLNGQISVHSVVGRETRFTVRLPLTLVIVPGLLVQVGGQVLVIPLSSVLETARLRDHSVYTVGNSRVLRLRDEVIPLIDLGQILHLRGRRVGDDGYAVVVGLANQRAGILVERLLGQEEIVVKPLGEVLSHTKVFAGGTILGDGKVRLVLDIGELLQVAQQAGKETAPAASVALAKG